MTESNKKPHTIYEFDVEEILAQYAPTLTNKNKDIVFELGLANTELLSKKINYSRWPQKILPKTFTKTSLSCARHDGFFFYPSSTNLCTEWHLNFAHHDLFGFYGGSLFAQDEMQVAEHPVLAFVREAILTLGIDRFTVENDEATPILFTGVERRTAIATDVNSHQDRPYGLYGNNFAHASEAAIKKATMVLNPATISNIIAIESPPPEFGKYTREQISFILTSAITGFEAAVLLTQQQNPSAKTSIHTGYWGCGAYGGNRELMTLLQVIAAHCANVDTLHFHTGGDNKEYEAALIRLNYLVPNYTEISLDILIDSILLLNYNWGVSDGN